MWLISRQSPCSPESVGSTSALRARLANWVTGSALSLTWRGKPLRWPLSSNGRVRDACLARLCSRMSAPSRAWVRPTWCWAGSPAKTSASQASAPASMVNAAGCGPIWFTYLGTFDPGSYSLRTSQGCLLTGRCAEFSETFPRSGSMRNGRVYARPTSVLRTNGGASLSWATPDTAPDAANSGANVKNRSASLGRQARNWLTPDVPNGVRTLLPEAIENRGTIDGVKRQVGLQNQAVMFILNGRLDPKTAHGRASLPNLRTSRPQLNPLFVEWLMGFPFGWTDLGRLETPSSRHRPKRLS